METIVGFIAGYLAGCEAGKDGLQRLRESLDAIKKSPETRRLVGEAMNMAQAVAQRATESRGSGSLGGTVDTVTDLLVRQVGGRSRSRAA